MSARAKLFTHGGSQAVRLPKAFRFCGSEVSIRKEGEKVILEPLETRETWEAFFARIDPLSCEAGPFPYSPEDLGEALDAPVDFDL